MLRLGSLFSGSGGFELAGSLCGIEPVFASEVEPYPIAVTKSRFPNMKHLGSVTDVHGGEIEPVDIITFGSPCQDLSVAGKRAGLKHEANGDDETTRSGLFMEAVRIIKEMREATNGEYPTFAVWENVPGAFSSNKGEDFRTVLEELIKIVEPTAVMPAVPKNGWPYADSYCGDGWSLAYRVFDAQYWGVPQRRRRIYLVLDLRGQRAGKVSFEREGLRWNFAESGTSWQGTAGDAANRSGADDCEGAGIGLDLYNFSVSGDIAVTLNANSGQSANHAGPTVAVPYTLKIRSGCEGGGKGALIQEDKPATLATNNDQYLFQPIAFAQNQRDEVRDLKDKAGALAAEPGMKQQTFVAVPCNLILDDQGGQQITVRTDGKAPTLRAETHGNLPCVLEAAGFKARQGAQARSIGWEDEKCQTLAAEAGGNSVPSVCIKECLPFDTTQVTSPQNGCNPKWGDPCHPLAAQGHPPTVICKCYDARGNGDGQTVSTLTGDHKNRITDYTSVVCMAHGQANAEILEDKSPCLNCNHEQPIVFDKEVYNSGVNATGGHYIAEGGPSPTLRTSVPPGVCVQYIVRRLTPTECARLQGFPDNWGHPDHKEDFTDEEYRFWLNVRNTHAAINGKPQKEYTKAQMLTWYNKLHTDSSEYKMWGNGISLPTALYVMQGIAEALKGGDSPENRPD